MAEPSSAADSHGVTPCNTVFIDTNLDTHLAMIVSDNETVSDLKEKILYEHPLCFPNIGVVKVHAIKVKRRGHYYHLSDSMSVKSAFHGISGSWFLSVDASSPTQAQLTHNLDSGNRLNCNGMLSNCSADRVGDVVKCLPASGKIAKDIKLGPKLSGEKDQKLLTLGMDNKSEPELLENILNGQVGKVTGRDNECRSSSSHSSRRSVSAKQYAVDLSKGAEIASKHIDVQHKNSLEDSSELRQAAEELKNKQDFREGFLNERRALISCNKEPFEQGVIAAEVSSGQNKNGKSDTQLSSEHLEDIPLEKTGKRTKKKKSSNLNEQVSVTTEIMHKNADSGVDERLIPEKNMLGVMQTDSGLHKEMKAEISCPSEGKRKLERKQSSNNEHTRCDKGQSSVESEEPNIDMGIRVSRSNNIILNDQRNSGSHQTDDVGREKESLQDKGRILSASEQCGPKDMHIDELIVTSKIVDACETAESKDLPVKKKKHRKIKKSPEETPVAAVVEVKKAVRDGHSDDKAGECESIMSPPIGKDVDQGKDKSGENENVVVQAFVKDDEQTGDKAGENGSTVAHPLGKRRRHKKIKKSPKKTTVAAVDEGVKSFINVVCPTEHHKPMNDDLTDKKAQEKETSLSQPAGKDDEHSDHRSREKESIRTEGLGKDDEQTDDKAVNVSIKSQPLGKRKKHKKIKKSAEEAPITTTEEHVEGFVTVGCSTEPQKVMNDDHTGAEDGEREGVVPEPKIDNHKGDVAGEKGNIVSPAAEKDDEHTGVKAGEKGATTSQSLSKREKHKNNKKSTEKMPIAALEEHVKGADTVVFPAGPDKTMNEDWIGDKAGEKEGIGAQPSETDDESQNNDAGEKGSIASQKLDGDVFKRASTALLGANIEATEMNGHNIESVQKVGESQVKKSKKKRSSIEDTLDLQMKDKTIGHEDPISSIKYSKGEILPKAAKRTKKTTSVSQSNGLNFDPEKDSAPEDGHSCMKPNPGNVSPLEPLHKDTGDGPLQTVSNLNSAENGVDNTSTCRSDEINFRDYFVRKQNPHGIVASEVPDDQAIKKNRAAKSNKKKRDLHSGGMSGLQSPLKSNENQELKGKPKASNSKSVQTPVNRDNVASRKSFGKDNGEVVNSSDHQKSMLAKSGAIFKDGSSDSYEAKYRADDSSSTTSTPSDNSSSDYSDEESNATLDSPTNGPHNLKRKDGGRSTKLSSAAHNLTMDKILRSSSRYKKAKLTASQSQLEETESQPVEFVPDSQMDL